MLKVALMASWVAHPPLRFIIGLWAVSCSGLAAAFSLRSQIEQWNAVGFLLAALCLYAAWPMRNMILAFTGFGIATCAAFVRAVSAVPVSDHTSGALVIFIAWSLITFKAAQRCASAFIAVVAQQHVAAQHG